MGIDSKVWDFIKPVIQMWELCNKTLVSAKDNIPFPGLQNGQKALLIRIIRPPVGANGNSLSVNDVILGWNCVTASDTCGYIFALSNSFKQFKTFTMGNLLYLLAVILLIGWAVGFFAFHVGGIIHVLLVIALIAVILRVIQGGRVV